VKRDTKLVLVILTAWFCLVVVLGLTGRFANASAQMVAATVWILTAIVLLSWWKIAVANRFANNVALSRLIALHVLRIVGIYFLILCGRGELSCLFAGPAGSGDTAVAVIAAGLLVWRQSGDTKPWRIAALAWNTFGLLDILVVVVTAFRIGLRDWLGMAPLRTLPLMLLPTFLVPLVIASHILIFVRLRKRRDELVSSH
jgi:hypothetical protein